MEIREDRKNLVVAKIRKFIRIHQRKKSKQISLTHVQRKAAVFFPCDCKRPRRIGKTVCDASRQKVKIGKKGEENFIFCVSQVDDVGPKRTVIDSFEAFLLFFSYSSLAFSFFFFDATRSGKFTNFELFLCWNLMS